VSSDTPAAAPGPLHDPLTGLRSRAGLSNEIARDPSLASAVDSHTAIVLSVQLPAAAGQRVLALVGMRLARSIRACDTAAHLGNGEFVIIVAEDPGVPVRTALRLKEALSAPYVIDGDDVVVRYKLGFARLKHDDLLARPESFRETAKLL
jgi:GGDEF domain-containing protein